MAHIAVRGIDVSYDLSGDGRDLIWGHGLTSSMAAEDQLPLLDMERLRTEARVLRYDARGHGDTSASESPDDYRWDQLALDQFALADALGIESYVAGGASMGAATALHAAVLAPERIRALLLVIPPTAWGSRAAQASAYRTTADLVEAGDHDTLRAGRAQLPSPDPLVDEPIWDERFDELLRTADPARLARTFRGAALTDLPSEDEIASIAVPTLVLAWTGDAGHPVSTAARLQELLPQAELGLATTRFGLDRWTVRAIEWLRTL